MDLPPSRQARALLAYLVATGRPHGRSALCDLLWGGVDDPRAGLRWALSKLRSAVDDDGHRRIVASRSRVEFDAEATVVDLHRARTLVSDDPESAPLDDLEEAVPVFRGEFLEGLDLPGRHQYQAWCTGMREQLRQMHLSLRKALTRRLRDEPHRALSHALAGLRLAPLSEQAYIAAIEVLAELGSIDRALELYGQCRRKLADELGSSPSRELIAVRRRLRDLASGTAGTNRPGESAAAGGLAGEEEAESIDLAGLLAELPPPPGLSEPGPDDPPLVGRTEEMAILAGIGRAGGDGAHSVVLVTGEAGIGKTRILRELVREVRSAGGWALRGPVFESEEIRPYGPWTDMIRALPSGALGEEPDATLSALLIDPGTGAPGAAPAERVQLFDAVTRLLERLTTARAPGLVVLDDVQWLDASSAALLHYAARVLRDRPLIFALAARQPDLWQTTSPARTVRSLEEQGVLTSLSLGRLSPSETERLVQAVGSAVAAAGIYDASEGNPLFALAMAESGRGGADRLPATIEAEMEDRLRRLEQSERALLPWAAALGRAFEVPDLVRTVGRPNAEIVDAIDGLERRGILRAAGPDRYDFSHSLLRQAAYRRVSAPARREIHRSIARALDGKRADRAPGSVAHQAELGGLPDLSARAYAEAAERSLWLCALDEAVELVRRGLAQSALLPDEDRIPREMSLLRLYGFRSVREMRPDDVEARVRRTIEEARDRGFTEVVAVGHATLTELEYQRGAFEEAGRQTLRSAEAGREGEPTAAIAALAKTGACLLLLDQAPEDARRLTSEAVELAGSHDVKMDVLALARALLHHHDGTLEEASRAFEEVVRLGRRARDRWWEGPALTRMTMVELDRGDPGAALARAREAETLAERLDDELEAAFARA
ncbi:MAG: ATP-binding protein, partial [Gemmatimonadota bacterium]